jgi:hypothetical protein
MKQLKISTKVLLVLFSVFVSSHQVYSQDFYINKNSEASILNYGISPQWKDLNIEESYDFLAKAGFSEIKTVTKGDQEWVMGKILGQEYQFLRVLVFEDKLIKGHTDVVSFIQLCVLCLARRAGRAVMFENSSRRAQLLDEELKNLFYKNHKESLIRDGIEPILMGDVTDFGFSFINSAENNDVKITRMADLKLDSEDVYNFYSLRTVELKKVNYQVGEFDLPKVNFYDLNLMVDVFLLDCKNNNIQLIRIPYWDFKNISTILSKELNLE